MIVFLLSVLYVISLFSIEIIKMNPSTQESLKKVLELEFIELSYKKSMYSSKQKFLLTMYHEYLKIILEEI